MTDVAVRAAAPSRSLLLTSTLAALWAAGLGLAAAVVVVVAAWAADPHSGAPAAEAVRVGAALWLLAHHGGLQVSGGWLGLVPLGLMALPAGLLVRAGRAVARSGVSGLGDAALAAGSVAAPYACLATAVAALAARPGLDPSPGQALAGAATLAFLAAGVGVLREAGQLQSLWRRLPDLVRRPLSAGAAAVGALVAAGLVLLVVSVFLHVDAVAAAQRELHPGVAGGVVLALLQTVLVPNAAVAAASYATGPGFALGAGTTVAPFTAHSGTVPALPLLAALPHDPVGGLVLAVPLACGVLAGVLLVRARTVAVRRAALDGLGAGACAGALFAALTALAGGPVGALAAVGSSPWQAGLALAGEVAAGATAAATLCAWRGWLTGG